jgi:ADP-heptose:LPS heptosyltransferase
MKFLVIRFSSIGDIVLTTPVVRCLKQQVPGAEIHFLTKRAFHHILSGNPYIDKIHLLDSSWDMMIHQLHDEGFNHIIDLHHNIRTLRVKKALKGVPATSFDKLNFRKLLLTVLKIDTLPKKHIVERYLDTLKRFGVNNDGKGLDYFIPEQEKIKASDLPVSHQMGYIGIVIGAALNTKKLPLHKLQELCSQLIYPVVLLGGTEDRARGNKIASIDPIRIYNACGKFSLNESADLVRHAKYIITHDTGLMHIAAAFQKRIVSVWGNTVPAFGMGPYYGNAGIAHHTAEVKPLWCRPCSKIGYKKCPLGHFKCMELQHIDRIAALETSMWKGDPSA